MDPSQNAATTPRKTSRRDFLAGLGAGGALAVAGAAGAADWPQWRGPQRNGVSSEANWKTQWGGGGPRQLWTANVGEGWSAVAVLEGKVYTQGNQGGKDYVHCLDAVTGKRAWTYSFNQQVGEYGGPRSTPAVKNRRAKLSH